jgi:hypothetical protein
MVGEQQKSLVWNCNMGSYTTLTFGHFTVGEWKSYVPLEPLLLFTQEDLHEEPQKTEDGYEYTSRKFIVSASVAKHRLDSRGFGLAACRRLFDEFRSNFLRYYVISTGEEICLSNEIDFDQYLVALEHLFRSHDHCFFDANSEEVDNPALRLIFREDFFDGTTTYY